jgi:hypothetical protein
MLFWESFARPERCCNGRYLGIGYAYGTTVDGFGDVYVPGLSDQFFVGKISTAVITVAGSPQQPLATNGAGNFVAQVTITNTSNLAVSTIQVTSATLGSGSLLSVPAAITNLAPGQSAIVTLTFPARAAAAGATRAPLKVSGTYSIPFYPAERQLEP